MNDEEAKANTDTLRTYAESEMPKAAAEGELKRADFDERHTLCTVLVGQLRHQAGIQLKNGFSTRFRLPLERSASRNTTRVFVAKTGNDFC